MFQEKSIPCVDCGQDFVFTVEEQEFYSQKGFDDPKRCKPCRQAKKQRKRGERQFHEATCSACGVQTMVPFQPDGSRPIYCRDCFQQHRDAPPAEHSAPVAVATPPAEEAPPPADEAPAEEASTEEAPAEETSAEEAPTEEAPAEETSAEEAGEAEAEKTE